LGIAGEKAMKLRVVIEDGEQSGETHDVLVIAVCCVYCVAAARRPGSAKRPGFRFFDHSRLLGRTPLSLPPRLRTPARGT
jgi:hypothetical protein